MSQTSKVSSKSDGKVDCLNEEGNLLQMEEIRKALQGGGNGETMKENVCPSSTEESQNYYVFNKNEENSFCDLVNFGQFKPAPSIKESVTVDQAVTEIRKKYNPRMSFPSATPANEIEEQVKKKRCKNFESGESPVDPIQIEMDNDELLKGNAPYCQRIKNYVLDYRDLRKSGYFLKSSQGRESRLNLMATKSMDFATTTPKTIQVENWINCLSEDSANLRDTDDDLMGEREFQEHSTLHNMPRIFTSEENILKRLLLNRSSFIDYTSEPTPTLTYGQLESILETANTKIENFLNKIPRNPQNSEQHQYVCGKIRIPSFLKIEIDNSQKLLSNELYGDSWLERMGTWVPSFLKSQEKKRSFSGTNRAEGCCVILEPYHGPVAVNGAVIESGATKFVLRQGILGTVVEEVKSALQAINEALRSVTLKLGSPTKSSSLLLPHIQPKEDPEIQRLTEMLLNKGLRRKSTFRTVFGLRNTDKIPSYSLLFSRRRRLRRQHGRGGFFRAVNGWIQRKTIGHGHHPYGGRYRVLPNGSHLNLAPSTSPACTDISRGQNNQVSGPNIMTGFMSAIRRSFVPLQLTPAIPAVSSVVGIQSNDVSFGRSRRRRRRRSHVSREESPLIVPTRYQISRSGTRNNKKIKSRHIHALIR